MTIEEKDIFHSNWDIGLLSDKTGIYIAADSVSQGQHSYIFITNQMAVRLGEALIKTTMPQNWDKEHLREITKPYPVNLASIREKAEPMGGA
jgi:hypothetical protein